jgi:hypothetical protein
MAADGGRERRVSVTFASCGTAVALLVNAKVSARLLRKSSDTVTSL